MKVIILAAGHGSRMYPMAQDMPKCLLTIRGETLLARQLRILRSCGISDVTVVTGFHYEKIVELYGEVVSIRYNPHYEITANMFSLWTVRDLLTDDVVIINADVIFTKEPMKALLVDKNPYCLIVDNSIALDEEAQRVKTVGDTIVELNKKIPIEEAYGEAIGIAKVKKEGAGIFKEAMFECVKRDSHTKWITIFQDIAEKKHQVNYILIDTPWAEIDTKKDYEEAQRKFRGGVAYSNV